MMMMVVIIMIAICVMVVWHDIWAIALGLLVVGGILGAVIGVVGGMVSNKAIKFTHIAHLLDWLSLDSAF